MVLSSAASWLLTAVASDASLDTVSVLRTLSFIAGGTAHVVALGVDVWLASRGGGFGRGVRGLAWVALVVSVASLVSLVVYEGAALILLGRLLCMIWTVSGRSARAARWPAGRGCCDPPPLTRAPRWCWPWRPRSSRRLRGPTRIR